MTPTRTLLATGLLAWIGLHPLSAADPATFTSAAKGNIFTADSGELTLNFPANSLPKTGKVILRNETADILGEIPLESAAGPVKVPLPGKGYYAVEAQFTDAEGKPQVVKTNAAVIGAPLDEALRKQSRLGLWNVQGDVEFAVKAGARWNRKMTSIRNLPIEMAEASPATLPPSPFKPDGQPLTNVGVTSFGLPIWMMDLPPDTKHKGFGNPLEKPKDWAVLAQSVKNWVKSSGENFPPYFEVYNEPEWHWKGSNEDLVHFLQTIAVAIKEARPDVQVLGPGFSSIRIKDPARLDLVTVEKQGLLDHLDGIVLHAYVDGSAPEGDFIERIENLQDYLKGIGKGDMPIHLTEFGWTTGNGTWQRPVDELTQARYVTRSLTLLSALGVENATYFCLLFKYAKNEGEREFSILRLDDTPKPSYASFSNVARWLAGVEGKGHWLKITPTTQFVIFRKADGDIAVVWDTETSRTLALPQLAESAQDMMGRPIELDASGTLTVSPSPIFLKLKDTTLYAMAAAKEQRVMRGNTTDLPAGGWIAAAPLQVADGKLTVPTDAPDGHYFLLARDGADWRGLPVKVTTPLQVGTAKLGWPADAEAPQLSVDVKSHAANTLSTLVAVRLDQTRSRFHPEVPITPGEEKTLTIPLEGNVLGQRYRGKLVVESRDGDRRDRLEQPLDFTVLTSTPVKGSEPDWSKITEIDFSSWDPFGKPSAAEDCSATFQSAYDKNGLYLRVKVRDDAHLQEKTAEHLWQQDGLQIGFDSDAEKTWEANDLFGLKGHRVFEYGVGWNGQTAMNWRWISYSPELPVGESDPRIVSKVARSQDITDYRMFFPWTTLGLKEAPKAGSAIGFALALTDADPDKSSDRRGLRLFGGITDGKDAEKFGKIWLR